MTPISEGGEGVIYDLNHNEVAKIYKPHIDLKSKERKIKSLLNVQSLPVGVIAPTDICVDTKGNFAGYTKIGRAHV